MYKQKYNQCAFHGLVHVHEIDMDTYLKIAATLVCESHVGRPNFNTVLSVFALCDCTNFGRNDNPWPLDMSSPSFSIGGSPAMCSKSCNTHISMVRRSICASMSYLALVLLKNFFWDSPKKRSKLFSSAVHPSWIRLCAQWYPQWNLMDLHPDGKWGRHISIIAANKSLIVFWNSSIWIFSIW